MSKPKARKAHIPGFKLASIYSKTVRVGDCWEWQGTMFKRPGSPVGTYPSITFKNKNWRGHRLVWTLIYGPIVDGLFVLHSCDNTKCLNPSHLRLGTNSDNVRDAVTRKRHSEARKTHCRRGHEYSGKNLLWDCYGGRRCVTCEWYRNRNLLPQAEVPKELVSKWSADESA